MASLGQYLQPKPPLALSSLEHKARGQRSPAAGRQLGKQAVPCQKHLLSVGVHTQLCTDRELQGKRSPVGLERHSSAQGVQLTAGADVGSRQS